jgi:hypothetical protein
MQHTSGLVPGLQHPPEDENGQGPHSQSVACVDAETPQFGALKVRRSPQPAAEGSPVCAVQAEVPGPQLG